MNNKYIIKTIPREGYKEAFSLIWDSFLKYDAPYYEEQGIASFRTDVIENPSFAKMLTQHGITATPMTWERG